MLYLVVSLFHFRLLICSFAHSVTIVHFGIFIKSSGYQIIEFTELFLRYSGMYTVIYFVFKKASKPLPRKERSWWIKLAMRPTITVFSLINVIFIIFLIVKIEKIKSPDTKDP